jgi:hypothetical protein
MVGVLYICTGKYICFWDNFYRSATTKFIPNAPKKFYVFTDKPWKFWFRYKNVIPIFIPKTDWPYSTLYRFKYFLSIKNKIEKTDYLFFFNANVVFQEEINTEFLPDPNHEFIGVKHPGFYNKTKSEFTYERRASSKAYIPIDEGENYFMGGVNGGKAKAFLKMCKTLDENIDIDLSNNIISIWHDESHLNRYFLDNKEKVKILNPDYGFPEGWNLPFNPKILIRDKSLFGGHSFLREQ